MISVWLSQGCVLIGGDENDRLTLIEALMLYAGALDHRELVWLTPRDPAALRPRLDDLLTWLYRS